MQPTRMIIEYLIPGILFTSALLWFGEIRGSGLLTQLSTFGGTAGTSVLAIIYLPLAYVVGILLNHVMYLVFSLGFRWRLRLAVEAFGRFPENQTQLLECATTHLGLPQARSFIGVEVPKEAHSWKEVAAEILARVPLLAKRGRMRPQRKDRQVWGKLVREIVTRATFFVKHNSTALEEERVFHLSQTRLSRGCLPVFILLGVDLIFDWKRFALPVAVCLAVLIVIGLWVAYRMMRTAMELQYRTVLRAFIVLTCQRGGSDRAEATLLPGARQ